MKRAILCLSGLSVALSCESQDRYTEQGQVKRVWLSAMLKPVLIENWLVTCHLCKAGRTEPSPGRSGREVFL